MAATGENTFSLTSERSFVDSMLKSLRVTGISAPYDPDEQRYKTELPPAPDMNVYVYDLIEKNGEACACGRIALFGAISSPI